MTELDITDMETGSQVVRGAEKLIDFVVIEPMQSLRVWIDLYLLLLTYVGYIDSIKRAYLELAKRHEDDRAFRHNCMDNERGEHDDEHRHESQAEVALVPRNIATWVLAEEMNGLDAAQVTLLTL